MTRETREITTPVDKHKVKIYTYRTLKEKNEINNILFKGADFGVEPTEGKNPKEVEESVKNREIKFDMSATMKMKEKAIELLVYSVNGETKSVLDKVMNMKETDGDFVTEEVDKLIPSNDKKK